MRWTIIGLGSFFLVMVAFVLWWVFMPDALELDAGRITPGMGREEVHTTLNKTPLFKSTSLFKEAAIKSDWWSSAKVQVQVSYDTNTQVERVDVYPRAIADRLTRLLGP